MSEIFISEYRQRFIEHQALMEKRAKGSRVARILDRLSPPLTVDNDFGDPRINTGRVDVTGIDQIIGIIHNAQEGFPLETKRQF